MQTKPENPVQNMARVIILLLINLECVFLSMMMTDRILDRGQDLSYLSSLSEYQSYGAFLLALYFLFRKNREMTWLFTALNCLAATGSVAGATFYIYVSAAGWDEALRIPTFGSKIAA